MIKKLNEFVKFNSLSEDELLEMANISGKYTGIKNVVIWVGPNPGYHWHRIKVSNTPNKIDINNLFTLTIPDFNIIGEVNRKLITTKVLDDIKKFVEINMDLIISYSNREVETFDFLKNIKSIKI